jgi:hypothetical protein
MNSPCFDNADHELWIVTMHVPFHALFELEQSPMHLLDAIVRVR